MKRRDFLKTPAAASLVGLFPSLFIPGTARAHDSGGDPRDITTPPFTVPPDRTPPGNHAWVHTGVPYPTDPLPGVSSDPNLIPVWPVEPNGAHYTGCDWYSGNPDSYDPCTIVAPTPPSVVTLNKYVVDKFHPNATDNDEGDNAIGGTVYGTTSKPRESLPDIMDAPVPAGTEVHIYGNNTPLPVPQTGWDQNRQIKDYTGWRLDGWDCRGTAAQPVWIIGYGHPRLWQRETEVLSTSSHLIIDGIVFEAADDSAGASWDTQQGSNHITFRYCHFYGNNKNGLVDFGSTFAMVYRCEVAYTGYVGCVSWPDNCTGFQPFSGVDRHGIRPIWYSRYTWIVECNIHSCSGDGIQVANSLPSHPGTDAASPHFVYITGSYIWHCGENAVDNKCAYHVIQSDCQYWDFQLEYNGDGGTAVILSNNEEGPWTQYNWIINCMVSDCNSGIRDSSDQDQETNWCIGNVLFDIDFGALREQDSDAGNFEYANWVNNTIYDCAYGYLRARQQITYESYFHGNLIANSRNAPFGSAGGTGTLPNDPDAQMGVERCHLYGNASGTPTTGWRYFTDNVVDDTPSGDPLLVDPANQDFRLQSASPAKGAIPTRSPVFGQYTALYGLDIAIDYLGNPVPATNLNVGAVQEVGVTPDPTPTRRALFISDAT